MKRQRYIAVLADESGKVLTGRSTISSLVKAQLSQVKDSVTSILDAKSTEAAYNERIRDLGYDSKLIRAIVKVESGAKAFIDGNIVIRFEPHVFQRLMAKKYSPDRRNNLNNRLKYGTTVTLPGIPVPTGARTTLSRNSIAVVTGGNISSDDGLRRFSDKKRTFSERQKLEYEALRTAAKIDEDLAYQSTSFGVGQIMGFNHSIVGYNSAIEMAEAFSTSVWTQKMAILDFIANNSQKDKTTGRTLDEAVKSKDIASFARVYNGDKKGKYENRIKQEYRRI